MYMENKAVESKPVALQSDLKKKSPATLQFFAVLEKGKAIKVLPALLNLKAMSKSEMDQLPLPLILSTRIVIPLDVKPWSDISLDADHFFLMIQSRGDWGEEIKPGVSLLRLQEVRKLVELLEESLNNCSWRKDLFAGKFYPPSDAAVIDEKPIPVSPEPSEGIIPGSNW